MPAPRACPVVLPAAERRKLTRIARGHTSAARDKLRAQIVLDAAAGHSNAAIARRRHTSQNTVRKWRGRFAEHGMAGLVDRERSGRPPRFTPLQRAQVMVHTPVHASWLNQAEIYFSVVQRKVLTPNDFTNLADVQARLEAFEIPSGQPLADHRRRLLRPLGKDVLTAEQFDRLLRRFTDTRPTVSRNPAVRLPAQPVDR